MMHETGAHEQVSSSHGDSDLIKAAQTSVVAAEEAYKAAKANPEAPPSLILLAAKVFLEETQATLALAMPRRRDPSSDVKFLVSAMKTPQEELEKRNVNKDEQEEDEELDSCNEEEVEEEVEQDDFIAISVTKATQDRWCNWSKMHRRS